MEEEKDAIKTDTETVATQEVDEDLEAKVTALEAEKAKLIEDAANYKVAFLKEKQKTRETVFDDETEEDKIRRIAQEEFSKTKIAQIDAEKESLLKKLVKENKELKLAHLNKGNVPVSTGSSNEGLSVKDTSITDEQMKAFKARGWNDKDIERYKKNLQRYAR